MPGVTGVRGKLFGKWKQKFRTPVSSIRSIVNGHVESQPKVENKAGVGDYPVAV